MSESIIPKEFKVTELDLLTEIENRQALAKLGIKITIDETLEVGEWKLVESRRTPS